MSPSSHPSRTGSSESVQAIIGPDEFGKLFATWRDAIRAALEAQDGAREPWALIGIKRGGAVLARRLWEDLSPPDKPYLYGEVDISLYRDDYHLQVGNPRVLGTEIAFSVDGVRILLVDDVLYTGRTVRAALDLILDFGRPRVIQLAALIDRGHRELPIAADYVGQVISTARDDHVRVQLRELGAGDCVELVRSS